MNQMIVVSKNWLLDPKRIIMVKSRKLHMDGIREPIPLTEEEENTIVGELDKRGLV